MPKENSNQEKIPVLIIDNSISFTGAFKCALQQALLLKETFEYIFVLPKNSDLFDLVKQNGFKVYAVPMLEIRRDFGVLMRYLPQLIVSSNLVRKIIKTEGIKVIVMNDYYNLLGVILKVRGVNIPLVTYVRFLPSALPGFLSRTWIGLARKYADKIVAVSDAVLHQLPRLEKCIRIYDAVVLEEKYEYDLNRVSVRPIEILYLGNYIRGKGHDIALEAFILAYQKNSNIRLVFAGGDMGLEKNRNFKRSLEQKVKLSGLEEVISFLPFESDIEQVIKRADIFLNCSEAESFSMTCAEASYYGTAVVATRCGGPEEIIWDGKTGILVENRSVPAAADAILMLASTPELRKKFSASGRAYIRQKFSQEQFVLAYKHMLAGLVDHPYKNQ